MSLFPGAQVSVVPAQAAAEARKQAEKDRRRMARERRGAGSSLVCMETSYYKTIY